MSIDKRVEFCVIALLVIAVSSIVSLGYGLYLAFTLWWQHVVPTTFWITGLTIIIVQNTARWIFERRARILYQIERDKRLQYARQVLKELHEEEEQNKKPPLSAVEIKEIKKYRRECKGSFGRMLAVCERMDGVRQRCLEKHRRFQDDMARNAPAVPTSEELEENYEAQRILNEQFRVCRERIKELKQWTKRRDKKQQMMKEEERQRQMQAEHWRPSLVVPTPPLPYWTRDTGKRPWPLNLFDAIDIARETNTEQERKRDLRNMMGKQERERELREMIDKQERKWEFRRMKDKQERVRDLRNMMEQQERKRKFRRIRATEEAFCICLWCLKDVLEGRYVKSNKKEYQLTQLLRHYKSPHPSAVTASTHVIRNEEESAVQDVGRLYNYTPANCAITGTGERMVEAAPVGDQDNVGWTSSREGFGSTLRENVLVHYDASDASTHGAIYSFGITNYFSHQTPVNSDPQGSSTWLSVRPNVATAHRDKSFVRTGKPATVAGVIVDESKRREEELLAKEFMRNFEAHCKKNKFMKAFQRACQVTLPRMQAGLDHRRERIRNKGRKEKPKFSMEEWERNFYMKFREQHRVAIYIWEEHCGSLFAEKTRILADREEDRRLEERLNAWNKLLQLDRESDHYNWPLEIQEWDHTSKAGFVAVGAITFGLTIGMIYHRYFD